MLMTSAVHPRRYRAALKSGADVCTLDLEDAVPPAQREAARRVASRLFDTKSTGCVRALRINSLRTADGLHDILALFYGAIRPDALLVPKVNCAHDLLILEDMLGDQLADVAFLATIETAAGLSAVDEIANATPRVRALVFGAADFAADLSISMEWEPLLYARSRIVTAAAAAGIPAIDAPTFDLSDDLALKIDVNRSRELGFGGKAAVHPRQVPVINDGFTPLPAEVERARRVIEMARERSGEIGVLDGQMVGPPMVAAARRLLARAIAVEAPRYGITHG
ncbi:HpcH/HpaI aldolase/citrate lyase family protein [Mycobacterium seoulense]|uniref:CoA ester lyase n=1 Tax=Mycobacterium seoulense TaxID=386911 RepID=A0A7I7P4N0_9MYCO|nr:CoA ester lyase [Mycobacterium seoulense]MCV7438769.1 CoA ester lyase [Mycobacterium seoulense]BBY03823.1 CoA ester lyase [Mycobacterium seoulense]